MLHLVRANHHSLASRLFCSSIPEEVHGLLQHEAFDLPVEDSYSVPHEVEGTRHEQAQGKVGGREAELRDVRLLHRALSFSLRCLHYNHLLHTSVDEERKNEVADLAQGAKVVVAREEPVIKDPADSESVLVLGPSQTRQEQEVVSYIRRVIGNGRQDQPKGEVDWNAQGLPVLGGILELRADL